MAREVIDDGVARCGWPRSELMRDYHDLEWGTPLFDDCRLFEAFVLGGVQAGLNWEIVLRKRARYRQCFAGFDPARVARFTPARVNKLLLDPGLVRNRLKTEAAVKNARAVLRVQETEGSFAAYLWRFVDGRPIQNRRRSLKDLPAQTPLAEKISRDLKSRGFTFVGATIVYATMQSIGLVNDHATKCFRHVELAARKV